MTFLNEINNALPPNHPWGQNIIHLTTVDSTNTYAKKLAQQGAPEGTVVIADHQTGGRGRMGRSFSSPPSMGLYFSLITRPHCTPDQLMHLTCSVGVAASISVEQVSGLKSGIKWTNDLVLGKKKLGGILTELSIDPATKLVDYAVIGIGINCRQGEADFPEEIRTIATSLAMAGANVSRGALAAALIEELYRINQEIFSEKERIMDLFRSRCVTIGQDISVLRGDHVFHGKALSVDNDGALLVRSTDGRLVSVASGEVSIRGMYGYL